MSGAAENEWIAWAGGECPVDGRVDVRFANGDEWHDYATQSVGIFFRYNRIGAHPDNNIIAYRVIP